MSSQSKKEEVRLRYSQCQNKKEKSVIISEVVTNLNIVRKSAIRFLRRKTVIYSRKRQGRKQIYGFYLILPLKKIWEIAGKPYSKRLKPQIKPLIEKLKEFVEIRLYGKQEELLIKMSFFTIDKLLEVEKDISNKECGLSGIKRSLLLKTLIPARTNFNL